MTDTTHGPDDPTSAREEPISQGTGAPLLGEPIDDGGATVPDGTDGPLVTDAQDATPDGHDGSDLDDTGDEVPIDRPTDDHAFDPFDDTRVGPGDDELADDIDDADDDSELQDDGTAPELGEQRRG
ncbi:hypothetical protein ITJ57_04405 [Plantibacter sp. VKM Ac-2880]|uniref:hypothetical protein n=1 Tax=Plantibacter sp. VKM Ac-2880 TaxID=2783827 RepID=UPI00188EE9D9|nr:hypothetical protein [Plantibacter sp. VKM Ac-2880]MBF4568004.1 hypothetical protein [Plantibacter sp. VKM Ac-2880]